MRLWIGSILLVIVAACPIERTAFGGANEQGIVLPDYYVKDIRWDDLALPVQWYMHEEGCINNHNNGLPIFFWISPVEAAWELGIALQCWNDVATTTLTSAYAGTTSEADVGMDGINLVTWADSFGVSSNTYARTLIHIVEEDIIVGSSNRDLNGDGHDDLDPAIYEDGCLLTAGTIVDADVKFNSEYYDWFNAFFWSSGVHRIASVAVHEFGHAFGLCHSPHLVKASTMFGYSSTTSKTSQDERLTLETDDVSGISRFYPNESMRSQYGAIGGRVILDTGSPEGAGGVSVVAIDSATGKTVAGGITYGLWMQNGTPVAGTFSIEWLPRGCYALAVEYFDGGDYRWIDNYNYDVRYSNVCNGNQSNTHPYDPYSLGLDFSPNGELYKPSNTSSDDLLPFAWVNVAPGQTVSLEDIVVNTDFPPVPADTTQITLDDDDYEEYVFTGGFTFPFSGSDYTSMFIGSNGYITLGSGDSDASESVAEFAGSLPRIAPLWCDLNPVARSEHDPYDREDPVWRPGGVYVSQSDKKCDVIYVAIPSKGTGHANTFSVSLYKNGTIRFAYYYVGAKHALVGVSPGGSSATTELNYTETSFHSGSGGEAVYELFSGNYVPPDVVDLSARELSFVWNESGSFDMFTRLPDMNYDGVVDFYDISILSSLYGKEAGDADYSPKADFNDDGVVNHTDLSVFASFYGTEF